VSDATADVIDLTSLISDVSTRNIGQYFDTTGCLQIQPNKFPDFQDTFNKFPVDFLH